MENHMEDPGIVKVSNGIITYAGPADQFHRDYIDLRNHYICAGFIDIHLHAIDGYDFMDGSLSSFKNIQQSLPQYGITSFLATSRTASYEKISQFLSFSNECKSITDASKLLGVHLEGPWINPLFSGAQKSEYVSHPDQEMAKKWLDLYPGLIKIVTLAPELPGSIEVSRLLIAEGTAISAGHTNANLEEMNRAIGAGIKNITHCFNAMSPFHHRTPGAAFSALHDDRLTCELIADGLHVQKDVVKFLYKVKTAERIILVSDCTGANRLEDGTHFIGNKVIHKKGKEISLANGTLAGSAITLDEAVRYVIKECGIPIHEAVKMATCNPAKSFSFNRLKGKIESGYEADLVILNRNFEVTKTIVNGNTVYEKKAEGNN
ncbi:N-acetylglucosamine-6-phosphate deacetylase [Bacillus sp. REN3]|uniref:N-acetylglucosamine-6-phosphate deacetylase n=1 Tax=Bacillus sp. REN3 TaxID=2802440 RepID=UPI001AED6559|nr:N-acetylglucosamine-6-phosphate deacetylase [Bacillus sp. REN3]